MRTGRWERPAETLVYEVERVVCDSRDIHFRESRRETTSLLNSFPEGYVKEGEKLETLWLLSGCGHSHWHATAKSEKKQKNDNAKTRQTLLTYHHLHGVRIHASSELTLHNHWRTNVEVPNGRRWSRVSGLFPNKTTKTNNVTSTHKSHSNICGLKV